MSKKGTVEERMQSAQRLRHIRENAGLTQEQFAEILGISASAYKKVESGENNISLASLRCLHKEMSVSADHVLFGETQSVADTWEEILNSSESDKMFILMRLIKYFSNNQKGTFPLTEEQSDEEKDIWQLIEKLLDDGKD